MKEEEGIKLGTFITVVVVGIIGLILIFGSMYTVDAGQKAVLLRLGAIQGEYGEGFHMKFPIIDDVVKFDSRVIKSDVKAVSYSKDAQVIDMQLSINYQIGRSASDIYRNLGVSYAETIIAPTIQDSVKKIVALYDAQSLLDNYGNASRDIANDLSSRLSTFGINVVGVSIVNHDYSDAFEQAVEAKQLATQQALKAENDLRRIEVEAMQQVASANASAQAKILAGQAEAATKYAIVKAEADSKLLLAQTEARALELQREQITPAVLELRRIEVEKEYASRWGGQLPKIVMGDSATPFVQLPAQLIADATQ